MPFFTRSIKKRFNTIYKCFAFSVQTKNETERHLGLNMGQHYEGAPKPIKLSIAAEQKCYILRIVKLHAASKEFLLTHKPLLAEAGRLN